MEGVNEGREWKDITGDGKCKGREDECLRGRGGKIKEREEMEGENWRWKAKGRDRGGEMEEQLRGNGGAWVRGC